jgi:hypothetical protein
LALVAHANAQLKPGLAFAQLHFGHDVHGAAPLQMRQRRRDLFLDLGLARTAFGSLPVEGKWLWLTGRRGTRGSYQDQNRPERD